MKEFGSTGIAAGAKGDGAMHPEAMATQVESRVRPLAEILACPPATASMLSVSAESSEFHDGDVIFRQGEPCRGLFVILSGGLLRKTERFDARLVLGNVKAGDLVELAATLGDGRHTYTLTAQSSGSLMRLPTEPLQKAFRAYPPLRMRLLEELAREVSKAYNMCCSARLAGARRRAVSRPSASHIS